MSDNINLKKLFQYEIEEDGMGLVKKLMEWGSIPREGEYRCPQGHVLKIRKDGSFFKWHCLDKTQAKGHKAKPCKYSISLRAKTIFERSHLSISTICQFVNLWVYNVPLNVIGIQTGIVSKQTLVDWSSVCREVVFDSMILRRSPIGGPGKIVEIDESKFGKRKYHRGHFVEGQWVFGGIERGSKKCFLVPVPNRTRQTLIPIIKDWILPGTTIMSDCWRPYDSLGDEGFQHLKVNHSVSFVDPVSGACTNSIEGTWRAAKRHYESSSRRKNFYAGYLAKYMFFKQCRSQNEDPFVAFMKAAGEIYNPLSAVEVKEEIEADDMETEEAEADEDFLNY